MSSYYKVQIISKLLMYYSCIENSLNNFKLINIYRKLKSLHTTKVTYLEMLLELG